MFDVISAAASISPRGEEHNEDRVAAYRGQRDPSEAGVVLCDGLGALPGSGAMAEEVRALAMEHMVAEGVRPGIWGLDAFLAGASPRGAEGATTLIVCAANGEGLVGHLLVGNGSLIEAVPSGGSSDSPRLLWTDISVPQISWEGGRPALRSVLPARNGDLEAAKGYRNAPGGVPRLYLACSDGISSEEERAQGAAPDGSLWKEVPAPLAQILNDISDQWDVLLSLGRKTATHELTALLVGRLAEIASGPTGLDDDASVAVVLLRPSEADSDAGPRR